MISAGWNHTAAITSMGRALCWGCDDNREVSGIPELNADETFVMISAGWDHTAAITSMGRALCWGCDDCDQVSEIPELNADETFMLK